VSDHGPVGLFDAHLTGQEGITTETAALPAIPASHRLEFLSSSLARIPEGGRHVAASRPAAALPPGRRPAEPDLDAVTGRVTAALLSRSHVRRLPRWPSHWRSWRARWACLSDLQQRYLALLSAGEDQGADTLPIDSTLDGRAYQVWIPLVDGTFFGGDRFVTALLCDLDLVTGLFTWIP
jgi:hypothetical protein